LVPGDGGASNDGASNDGAAEAKNNRRMPEQKDQQARDEKHPIQQAAAAPAQDQKAKDDKGASKAASRRGRSGPSH
jgi:hypothetical protein